MLSAVRRLSPERALARVGLPALAVLSCAVLFVPQSALAQGMQSFVFTGAAETFVVPAGVTTIDVEVYGAQGNTNVNGDGPGGQGGKLTATIPVTAGETLEVRVGGGGGSGSAAGFNGGGDGGTSACAASVAGGGGGMSDIRRAPYAFNSTDVLAVAAGGGGAGGRRIAGCGPGAGGAGGGGWFGGGGGGGWQGVGGGGGTQVSGGAGGASGFGTGGPGAPGGAGTGGAGAPTAASNQGGTNNGLAGGHGGADVGAAGVNGPTWTGGTGGGGSNFANTTATSVVSERGIQSGDGEVVISWGAPTTTTSCDLAPVLADIANLESKLDDEVRFTDDGELAAAQTSINVNVDAAETSINLNVDAAETSINANVDAAETSINANVDAAETSINANIDAAEANILSDIQLLESKLDDEARFTDDTELDALTTAVEENQAILEDAKSEIMLLESKLDDLGGFTDAVQEQLCEVIDLLLTKENDRCSDTLGCGVGAWPTGLDMRPPMGACAPTSGPVPPITPFTPVLQTADRHEAPTTLATAQPSRAELQAIETLVGEFNDAALAARRSSRAFIATALVGAEIEPLLVMPAAEGGMLEDVVELVRQSLELYRGFRMEPSAMYAAEDAFAEAERLRQDRQLPAAYRAYRRSYLSLKGLAVALE